MKIFQQIKIGSERKKRAMDYVNKNGSITNKIYQELNNISKPTTTRDLAELVSVGIFEINGKGRTLRYLESAHNRLGSTLNHH